MHQSLDIARGLASRIALAVVAAVVSVTCCAARPAFPPPVEAGYPSDLINRPVCAAAENLDDARSCRTTGWPEGRNRLYRPIR